MKEEKHPKSKTRVVQYRIETAAPGEDSISETEIERVLTKAREDGTVSMHDTGRGRVVWFEGCPGRELRAVKARVLALVAEAKTLRRLEKR